VFQKELYSGIPNVTVWSVLRKRLHLKAYKLSIVKGDQGYRDFEKKRDERFKTSGYVEIFAATFMQSKLYYESMRITIRIACHLSAEVSKCPIKCKFTHRTNISSAQERPFH
jgi:hypothetical protein